MTERSNVSEISEMTERSAQRAREYGNMVAAHAHARARGPNSQIPGDLPYNTIYTVETFFTESQKVADHIRSYIYSVYGIRITFYLFEMNTIAFCFCVD